MRQRQVLEHEAQQTAEKSAPLEVVFGRSALMLQHHRSADPASSPAEPLQSIGASASASATTPGVGISASGGDAVGGNGGTGVASSASSANSAAAIGSAPNGANTTAPSGDNPRTPIGTNSSAPSGATSRAARDSSDASANGGARANGVNASAASVRSPVDARRATSAPVTVGAEEPLVTEVTDAQHAIAQLLGIEDGSICPSASEPAASLGAFRMQASPSGQKHGCRLGCRCGVFQRCYSKPYVGEGVEAVDIGICRLAFPALMAIFAAVSVTVWMGTMLLRAANAYGDDGSGAPRPKLSRSELEARLRSATALSHEQRKAILDQFCGKRKEGDSHDRLDMPIPKGSQVAVTS